MKPCVAGFRAHLNTAFVLLDDALNRVEAEARAFADSLGGKERFEDMRLHFRRNSRSIIGDLNYDTIVLAIRSDLNYPMLNSGKRWRPSRKGERGAIRIPSLRDPYTSRRLKNASRSNRCTSCSFLSSAPCSGGISLRGSRSLSISGVMSSLSSSFRYYGTLR